LAALSTVEAAVECYSCVTSTPSWAKAKCAGQKATGCLFCTKATFGNALVVRGCVKGAGKPETYTDNSKLCKKYEEYFKTSWATPAMKKQWAAKKKYFDASCTATKNKEPMKGYACKKKLCNAAPATNSTSYALFLGALTVFGLRSYF